MEVLNSIITPVADMTKRISQRILEDIFCDELLTVPILLSVNTASNSMHTILGK
jgi:hypothetical protein